MGDLSSYVVFKDNVGYQRIIKKEEKKQNRTQQHRNFVANHKQNRHWHSYYRTAKNRNESNKQIIHSIKNMKYFVSRASEICGKNTKVLSQYFREDIL